MVSVHHNFLLALQINKIFNTTAMSNSSLSEKSSYLSSRIRSATPSSLLSSSTMSVEPGRQHDVIGFYNVPDQIQRKVIRKGFDFTVLVAGESGLGKSTFINTMFIQDLYKDRSVPLATDLIKRTVQIEKRSVEIEEFGIKLRLTVVDTPGYGDALNSSESWKPIRDYIEQQYEQYFQAESSVNRRNIQDTRVHCCIYFIPPNGYGLHKLDIEFMRQLQDLVNIIPVIAKADTLTTSELQRLKEKVKRDIADNQIGVYDFSGQPLDPDESDDAAKRWNRELQDMIPFAVIGGNTTVEVNGRKMRARAYPWGIIEIDNKQHCDFSPMREMLVSTHMQDMKDRTVDVHYENYRARRLLSPSGGQQLQRTSNQGKPEGHRHQHPDHVTQGGAAWREQAAAAAAIAVARSKAATAPVQQPMTTQLPTNVKRTEESQMVSRPPLSSQQPAVKQTTLIYKVP